jgi:hypothetical protein
MSAFGGKADTAVRQIWSPAGRACYFLIIIVIVIRHETTAAARWALLLMVRTLSNDAITECFLVIPHINAKWRKCPWQRAFWPLLASRRFFPNLTAR